MLLADMKLDRSPMADEVKRRCHAYLVELLKEMCQWFPTNLQQLESLADLSPSIVLGHHQPMLSKLSFLSLFSLNRNLGLLEQQCNYLRMVSWTNTDDSDAKWFWTAVANHTDAANDHDYAEIRKFALSVLSLPFSIAAVAQTFSQMNIIKLKVQNRMYQELLEAILHIHAFMLRNNICCTAFVPSAAMLDGLTSDMYIGEG